MSWVRRFILAVVLTVSISLPVHAMEQISNFNSKVTVQQDGRVDVVETIDYDFSYESHHGIYRYIPVVYTDANDRVYKPGFKFDAAKVDGLPTEYKTSRNGNNEVIQIGDAAVTLTGAHAYTIAYHFDSLLVAEGGDLLRFNVTGSGWTVPIQRAAVQIVGPANFKTTCYVGNTGSVNNNCDMQGMDTQNTIVISKQPLNPGDDFTVESLWSSGSIASLLQPYKEPWWVSVLFVAAGVYFLVGVGLLVAALIRLIGIRHAEKKAERNQTIVAQYDAPKGLTPGEIGLLVDNKTSLIEVTATLIQAAVSGYIKIEQIAEKSLLRKAEYKLTKLKDFSGLDAREQLLLTTLFDAKTELNLKDINRSTVPAAITKYQSGLRESLKSKGMYTKTSKFMSAGAAAGLVVLIVFAFSPLIFVLGIGLVPLSLYYYKRAGQVPRRTPEGLESWAYVEGFKLFLSVTEKDRLAFTDAPERTPRQFSKLLPYAIALGVEKQWAAQFEGIDVAQSMGWYGGNTQVFTAGYLVGNLSDSFASTVASSVAPQTSSGGFGGGSSGGGFGGGGGGSW